jgi:hypothetical protein
VEVLRDGSANLHFWDGKKDTWSQSHVAASPDADGWQYHWGAAAIDQQNKRILLPQGYLENDRLVMKVVVGTLSVAANLVMRDFTETKWLTDKKDLFGEIGPNVRLSWLQKPGARSEWVAVGPGILNGPEAYIPYALHACTYYGMNNSSNGPFNCGVFHSLDSGKTWQMERISERDAGAPVMRQTTGHYYYFAGDHPLWFSRKPREGGKWEEPQAITRTFAIVDERLDVAGEGDTAHICWMDRRHNKWRFNIDAPPVENNEIFYRRRKDADPDWSKEILLSKGLLYAYAPSLSAEGDMVVVVWAGIRSADKWHTDMGPNDIYYVTSKDGGKTWTDPLKVTDGAKDGSTAGMPQVALLNGTIHLLYTQGKRAKSEELSPGLTKLGGEPWPIYYTHRPFPN